MLEQGKTGNAKGKRFQVYKGKPRTSPKSKASSNGPANKHMRGVLVVTKSV